MNGQPTGRESIEVFVNGQPVKLHRGAEVRHALIAHTGNFGLVKLVELGKAKVVEEKYGYEMGLGGALFTGARLVLREVTGSGAAKRT